jgi:adenylate cyclase
MGVEIERKFLVDTEKWQQAVKPAGTYYRQGYLLIEDKRTIRVRVTDKQAFITIKGATAGISRKEFEYEIPVADGTELLNGFAISEIEKIRYRLYFGNKLWEIDDFLGDNSGLLVAEIELQQENEGFDLPDWITLEVSHDAKYYNSNLSKNPYKNWDK